MSDTTYFDIYRSRDPNAQPVESVTSRDDAQLEAARIYEDMARNHPPDALSFEVFVIEKPRHGEPREVYTLRSVPAPQAPAVRRRKNPNLHALVQAERARSVRQIQIKRDTSGRQATREDLAAICEALWLLARDERVSYGTNVTVGMLRKTVWELLEELATKKAVT